MENLMQTILLLQKTKPFVWNDRVFMANYCAVATNSKLYLAILIEVLNNLKGIAQAYCLGEQWQCNFNINIYPKCRFC